MMPWFRRVKPEPNYPEGGQVATITEIQREEAAKCAHMNCEARANDIFMTAFCLDCGQSIPLWTAVNILMDAMRKKLEEKK